MNRYRNGWAASSAATKAYVDETVRRRGKPVGGKPAISLAELPVPMPISRFLWPFVRSPSLMSKTSLQNWAWSASCCSSRSIKSMRWQFEVLLFVS